MRIGLLGFGTVGKGVYELTGSRPDMEVVRVLCRRDLTLDRAEVTHQFEDILQDPTIDTVVEAIGGLHPAYEYVRAAILAGKNIVTANKALVSTFYDDLLPLTEKMGTLFRCTASVGGGIGWLSELERVRRLETVRRVGGIMNGTCNYILDAMTRSGSTYAEALRQAQELGYAEANPSTDVDGLDTWHKLVVSANIAFGVSLDMPSIPVAGIGSILAEDVARFTARGLTCKLISFSARRGGSYSAYVQPTLFPNSQPESIVPTNFNLITLVGDTSGKQSFLGQGAGRYPTAYNVLQDCIDFQNGRGFYCPYGPKKQIVNDDRYRYYVRGASDAWLDSVTEEDWDGAVLTRPVTVSQLHAWLAGHPGVFAAALSEPDIAGSK